VIEATQLIIHKFRSANPALSKTANIQDE
jgi:hypothetical protein